MVKKSGRILSMLLAVAMLLTLTIGCAKTEKNPTSTPTTTKATQATAKATTAAPKDVKLKFATWDFSVSPEYAESLEAFEKANPGITVEPLEISAKEYTDKITIMLAGGDDTDILGIKDMPTYSGLIGKNQIVALDDFIKNDNLDMGPYAGIDKDIMLNGKLYELPYRSDFWILYYNKDIFDKANVPYPTDDMTFDQFRELAKKVTSGSGNEKIYGAYAHTWKSTIINWSVADKKGTLIDGTYDFLKPSYEVFLPMQNEDKSMMDFVTAKTSSAHYKGQFESGNTGMILMGTWFIGTMITDKKEGTHNVNWGITRVPHFPGSASGTTFGNVTGNAINAKSKNQEAAWKLVKFIGTEEGAKIFANRGVMPAYRTDAVLDIYKKVDGFPAGSEKALTTSSVALEFPPHEKAAAIDKALQEEHELIMINNFSIDDGIKSMNKRVQDILNEK